MTDRLAKIKARHYALAGARFCNCGVDWPCENATLLAEVERLTKALEAAKEQQAEWCWWYHHPRAKELAKEGE